MPDRRSFLRRSLLGAPALYFSPLLSGCGAGEVRTTQTEPLTGEKSSNRLGVALCGLGSYSKGQLAPALQETQHCYLAGLITGSPEKVPQWRAKYTVPDANVYSYDTMAELSDNPDIDVVYIVVPTGLHAEYAVRAAQAGKHVWCEKPMALDVPECQRIIDACAANGVRLSVAYRMQHETNTQRVMTYATERPFGDIRYVEALAGYGGSVPSSGWRSNPAMGGGALYDMGVYTINGLRYATDRFPTEVVRAERTLGPTGVDVTTTYELRFPGIERPAAGKTSVVETMNRLRVEAARGWYELAPMQQYAGVKGRTSTGDTWPAMARDQQAVQMDNDALAILNDTPMRVPGIEGLRDVAIIRAIVEADRTGAPVAIPQV